MQYKNIWSFFNEVYDYCIFLLHNASKNCNWVKPWLLGLMGTCSDSSVDYLLMRGCSTTKYESSLLCTFSQSFVFHFLILFSSSRPSLEIFFSLWSMPFCTYKIDSSMVCRCMQKCVHLIYFDTIQQNCDKLKIIVLQSIKCIFVSITSVK